MGPDGVMTGGREFGYAIDQHIVGFAEHSDIYGVSAVPIDKHMGLLREFIDVDAMGHLPHSRPGRSL